MSWKWFYSNAVFSFLKPVSFINYVYVFRYTSGTNKTSKWKPYRKVIQQQSLWPTSYSHRSQNTINQVFQNKCILFPPFNYTPRSLNPKVLIFFPKNSLIYIVILHVFCDLQFRNLFTRRMWTICTFIPAHGTKLGNKILLTWSYIFKTSIYSNFKICTALSSRLYCQ